MGLLANLPVGLAPGLGLNAYVRAFLITYRPRRILSFAVCIFRGRSKRKWVNHVSRSTCRRVYGRVSTPRLFEQQKSLTCYQMDIPLSIPHRLAAVARADYATISRARCRRGDRPIYSVSVKHRGVPWR